MKILYLGYWSVNDSLTQSVIIPRLKILSLKKEVDTIIFCSVERKPTPKYVPSLRNVKWVGLQSVKKRNVLQTKFSDFFKFSGILIDQVRKENIDLVIANSTLAGAMAFIIAKKTKVIFVVDCFEPHADYMHQSDIWRRWDPRFLILRYFERKQKQNAWRLLTVSNNYSLKLIEEGVDHSKIITIPNTLDIKKFSFNVEDRRSVRARLNFVNDALVGIYVGKFGGIYYDLEAFDLFKQAFTFFGNGFRLIILTEHSKEEIAIKLKQHSINPDFVHVDYVAHHNVPQYLSASDFAFATIKPAPCRLYCSPIKNGEYWANGLPILLENGIGDDSGIIKEEGGGVIYQKNRLMEGFMAIRKMVVNQAEHSDTIVDIAKKHRDGKILVNALDRIINDFLKQKKQQ